MKAIGRYLLSVGAIVLCAASEAPSGPEPPAVLAPYIEGGKFEAGDYGWMKGRFEDASEADKAAWQAFVDWREDCFARGRETLRVALAERGYPDVDLSRLSAGEALCEDAGFIPFLPTNTGYADFAAEFAVVRPIVESYLFAVRRAEDLHRPRSDDLGALLRRRVLGEQMLRVAMSWGQGGASDAPSLSPLGRAIAQAMIGREVMRRDRANTAWLKGVLEKDGWPRLSQVSEEAAGNAWLLAQHADMDPAFQVDALRAMEALLPEGEVSVRNYAYLYDRVMLKLAGTQRYATQMTCVDGEFVPQPLEEGVDVDAMRKSADLPTLAEYREMMLSTYGECSSPPR